MSHQLHARQSLGVHQNHSSGDVPAHALARHAAIYEGVDS